MPAVCGGKCYNKSEADAARALCEIDGPANVVRAHRFFPPGQAWWKHEGQGRGAEVVVRSRIVVCLSAWRPRRDQFRQASERLPRAARKKSSPEL
jgi:hypothetical protein